MECLRELQQQFTAALFSKINPTKNLLTKSAATIDKAINSSGLAVQDRLQIHRNNVVYQLTKALRQIYPTVELLVGIDFFKVMALDYIKKYPSTTDNLYYYGHQLNHFLKAYPHAKSLPYLSEIAALDWAYHKAYYGENGETIDRNKLSQVPNEKYELLQFHLHPTAQLLACDYPVLDIWNLCHNPLQSNDMLSLNPKSTRLLIIRPDLDVYIISLNEVEFTFLSALQNQQSFVSACSHVLNFTSEFDIQHFMQLHINKKTIIGFS